MSYQQQNDLEANKVRPIQGIQGQGYQGQDFQGQAYQGYGSGGVGNNVIINQSHTNQAYVPIAEPIDDDEGFNNLQQQQHNKLIQEFEVTIRHGFVRKVFAIVFVQLLVTFGFAALCTLHTPTKNYMLQNTWPVALGLSLPIALIMYTFCCGGFIHFFKSPNKYILLSFFTLGFAISIGYTCAQINDSQVVVQAMGITAGTAFVMSLFGCQRKYDFSGAAPFLVCGTMILCFYGLFAAIIGGNAYMVYAVMGSVLFSFYIIYDVQQIMKGSSLMVCGVDDSAIAALTLYLDLINLFQFILELTKDCN